MYFNSIIRECRPGEEGVRHFEYGDFSYNISHDHELSGVVYGAILQYDGGRGEIFVYAQLMVLCSQ